MHPSPIVPLVGPIKVRDVKLWRFEYRTREISYESGTRVYSEWSQWRHWQCKERERKQARCNLRVMLYEKGYLSDRQQIRLVPEWKRRKYRGRRWRVRQICEAIHSGKLTPS